MYVYLLERRSIFLKDLQGIPLKCHHQEDESLFPPVFMKE